MPFLVTERNDDNGMIYGDSNGDNEKCFHYELTVLLMIWTWDVRETQQSTMTQVFIQSNKIDYAPIIQMEVTMGRN
jgi:hypothetical protein